MKDGAPIFICVAGGLVVAFLASAPLRKPVGFAPAVGTSLQSTGMDKGALYAEGTIELSPSLKKKNGSAHALFIIARTEAGGPPVAVKKIAAASFPLSFKLSTADNMVGTDFVEGDLLLLARLDADGLAGPRSPEDREGSAAVGPNTSRRVSIVIE